MTEKNSFKIWSADLF